MFDVLFDSTLWSGIIIGIVFTTIFFIENKPAKKVIKRYSIQYAETLKEKYRAAGEKGIEEFINEYIDEKGKSILDRRPHSAYQLWCDIVIYITHKYADYNFNDNDSHEWHDIVEKTFEYKTPLNKFDAVNEILNRSTNYYLSNGHIKDAKTSHYGVYDYADDDLYKMIAYILLSSSESSFSFKLY